MTLTVTVIVIVTVTVTVTVTDDDVALMMLYVQLNVDDGSSVSGSVCVGACQHAVAEHVDASVATPQHQQQYYQ